MQKGAAPFANWNERIAEECYAPLAELGAFAWLSFDVGSTLLQWLERERPDVYARILEADRQSAERLGHGNAIAQPYHHLILPLAPRDLKVREVRWGMEDFARRFGRETEGMWLPETAVDRQTLEVLDECGVAFTVLAPHQVVEPPPRGVPGWVDLGGGRSIAVFVYDGDLSHGVAFGELLKEADAWLERIGGPADGRSHGSGGDRLVSIATDGETFGHHHRGAEQTLAEVLRRLRESRAHRVENFASFLAAHPPGVQLELVEPSSWSCAHGVERWRSACGCRMAPEKESQQEWRRPLREALDALYVELDALYRERAPAVLRDPEAARLDYGRVMRAGVEARRAFLERVARTDAGSGDAPTASPPRDRPAVLEEAATLLEMMRDAGAMFTSCGWFFDDIAGLEPLQVLRYAAHAIDLASRLDPERAAALERALVAKLAEAASNDPEAGDAARLYEREIRALHPFGSGGPRDRTDRERGERHEPGGAA